MFDVGFAGVGFVMGKLERGDINGEGAIKESDWFGAILNS